MLCSHWIVAYGLMMPISLIAAESPKQMAARHQCLGCHAVDEVRAGPAFQQIAERYAERQNVIDYLLKEVKTGSVGKWGATPMPPEPGTESDLKQILLWVMQH